MYVKIRNSNAKPGENEIVVTVTKKTLIKQIKERVQQKWNYLPELQRLYYKGKQLHDDNSVMDYDIKLNDVIQLLMKTATEISSISKDGDVSESNVIEVETECSYYKKGDLVDIKNINYGAWCEAIITSITKKVCDTKENYIYYVQVERNGSTLPPLEIGVPFEKIRPRSKHTYKFEELSVGLMVLANYNVEKPDEIGYWYDLCIDKLEKDPVLVQGRLFVGDLVLHECQIKFVNEIMKIEVPICQYAESVERTDIPLRNSAFWCESCQDADVSCRECGCFKCGLKSDESNIIMCDECDCGYHLTCLDPPLTQVPNEPEWFCPLCKNDDDTIVKAGEKVKVSEKRARMPGAMSKGKEWGRGMACVGRTTECTLVPKTHYGPIPGIEVGMCWKFRFQVSEAGVHRPHVAGIHGRETDGAYSLVLSGGYEDDVDNGEEFIYTGSGGRDLSGNKRVSAQSSDQTLTRMNKALAKNCNENDWKAGKPVRVVRNYKLGKHSKYAPKEGNRYDGLYKVVKYYCENGKSGFKVWKYVLRRDDPVPPPWDSNGKEFDVIYPAGYLEAHEDTATTSNKGKSKGALRVKTSKKRPVTDDESPVETKKCRLEKFTPPKQVTDLIAKDTQNEKLWTECSQQETKQAYLAKVQEQFFCICCQEVVFKPVTTPCKHNLCLGCMERSFAAEIYSCPCCRTDLDPDCMEPNTILGKILNLLLPGYEEGR